MTQLPITGLPSAGLPADVLVCGDPARAAHAAQHLDGAVSLSAKREYHAFTGRHHDRPIAICSHGIGAPGAAIAFEELILAGARRIIRIGTCGAIQPDLGAGALVVAEAAVQRTGYGVEVVPTGFPAAADPALTLALQAAAGAHGRHARSGIVVSRDAFYPGAAGPYTPDYMRLSAAGVLAVEMECAALFLVGRLRGVATAAILAVDGNVLAVPESADNYRPDEAIVHAAVDAEIIIALAALVAG